MKKNNDMKKLFNNSRGFSLLETLIYVALLASIIVVLINVMVGIATSQRSIISQRNIENSAMITLDRITRELRQATGVDAGSSTLGTNPGVLVLDGLDASENPRTVEFYITDSTIYLEEDSIITGPLTHPDVRVSSLIFHLFTGTNSQGVRTELVLESGTSTHYRRETFYSTAILR